jgi:choline dehydrogenase-like flavoprotein
MGKDFDVIVIGSGMSGGWAAKEFCERGFKTLVIERGRDVKHIKDYPTAWKNPWDFEYRGTLPRETIEKNPVISRCYAYNEATEHFFVKDNEHPYKQAKPFDWIRGYQVGGKSLLWARQVQRWSKNEFKSSSRDKYAIPWPIGYDDISKWYTRVESFIGVSGNKDGLDEAPDGEFLKPWEMNAVEKYIQKRIKQNFKERTPVIGRCAHLTEIKDQFTEQGRTQCQARTLCERGCPLGGYYSSTSSTLPWADKTGNLTLLTDSIVEKIIYDEQLGKAKGVRIIGRLSKKTQTITGRCIFVNAATINSNLVLLNSTSNRFPSGLGNDNGLLGRYISFHNYRGRIDAKFDGYKNSYYSGRRPTAIMMPTFRNKDYQDMPFKGGYMVFYSALRENWYRNIEGPQYGKEFVKNISKPGRWNVHMSMQGENIPVFSNHVKLSEKTDNYGIPIIEISVGYNENDDLMLADFLSQGEKMLQKAGCIEISPYDTKQAPGLDIHEVGGARMGNDPNQSILNKWNQMHLCPNVFVGDGACMTSSGTKNPSLTFMAITARAANFAADQLALGNI